MRAYCIFDDFSMDALNILQDSGVKVTVHPLGVPRPNGKQMKSILEQHDCVIIGTSQKITEEMFENIFTPKIIATASVGIDHIQVPFEKTSLITIFNTPGANAPSVAEYNVGAILMARKRLMEGGFLYAEGFDNKKLVKKPEDVSGIVVGFVGAGRVSTRTMELLQPFGVSFLCHTDDAPQRQYMVERFGVRFVPLLELASKSDVISVNVPSTVATAGLISADVVAAMKDTAVFVSIARERVLDLNALFEKAENNPNFYVILDLDVLPDCVSRSNRRNIIITPHIAGGTIESRKRMFLEAAKQVAEVAKS